MIGPGKCQKGGAIVGGKGRPVAFVPYTLGVDGDCLAG